MQRERQGKAGEKERLDLVAGVGRAESQWGGPTAGTAGTVLGVCVCARVRLPGIAPKVPGREDPDVLQGKDSKEGPSSTRFGSADYGHRPRYLLSAGFVGIERQAQRDSSNGSGREAGREHKRHMSTAQPLLLPSPGCS